MLEQKVYKNRLKKNEFRLLLRSSLNEIISYVDEFYNNNKIDQLFKKFKYFTASTNENEYKNAILALVYIFEKRRDFSIYEATIIDQIGVFAHKLVNDDEEGLNIDLKVWSLDNIFKNETFNIETRILLFGHLRNGALGNKFEVTYWGFNKKELDDLILELFQEYIDNFANKITNPNDYSLYLVYHTIKIEIQSQVIEIIKDFWRRNNLELLCAQITELDTWSSLSFKISNMATELFNSPQNFIEFVKEHKESNKPAVKEFLELFELLEISEFKYTCMYKFSESQLMKTKIASQKKIRDEDENILQLVYETNNKNLFDSINIDREFQRNYSFRVHKKNMEQTTIYYVFVYLKKSISKDPVLTYFNDLNEKIIPSTDWENSNFIKENIKNGENLFVKKDNDNYLKVISIEPTNKNDFPNYETNT